MATQYLVSPSSRGKKARIWQEDRHQRIRILLSTFKGGTHSIDVALKMRGAPEEPRANEVILEVILLGGLISERILSTVGIDYRHGATNYHHGETEVARAMVGNAGQVVILA
jgi:hypothetical protein